MISLEAFAEQQVHLTLNLLFVQDQENYSRPTIFLALLPQDYA